MMSDGDRADGLRLQVYLARAGVASRRACERLIAEGRVAVNGAVVAQPGARVQPSDRVLLDGSVVATQSAAVHVALHKPRGYLCTNADPEGRPLAASLLPDLPGRLFHVGRLDMASSGLIFFTNDGGFALKVTHPSFGVEKEYVVRTSQPIDGALLERYRAGYAIGDITYRLLRYERIDAASVKLTLVEGRNREIRRVLDDAGLRVQSLIRRRIGPVSLRGLAPGSWRRLDAAEVEWFQRRQRRPRKPDTVPLAGR